MKMRELWDLWQAATPDQQRRAVAVLAPPAVPKAPLLSPADAAALVLPYFDGSGEERLVVVPMLRNNRPLGVEVVSVGNGKCTIVDPAVVLRRVMAYDRAVCFIIAHNHPSRDTKPSAEDIEVTRRLCRAAEVIGITLLDHLVVVDGGGFQSLAALGHIPTNARHPSFTGN